MQLRPYQIDGINQVASKYAKGETRIIYQLPTGAGKTVTFAALIERYLKAKNKETVVCVHRLELLKQTQRTLMRDFKIPSELIVANKKYINKSKVYIGMVETLNNRLKKNANWGHNIGLVIIDEVHIGNFKKLYDYFPNALIIGTTATPISASKKTPLKKFFTDIVTGPQIMELIKSGSLAPNITYSLKGIEPKKFGIKGGEYKQDVMAQEYSRSKNVHNTLAAFRKHCNNEKTIIFNVNINHSKLVTQTFVNAGYNCRHLDGTESSETRTDTFNWFKNTPDAILCNVGVATTGYDEPTIRNVIINKSTMSVNLWLQMTGRGSRMSPGKNFFRIIDMGANAKAHGDWSIDRDWADIFMNPDKPSKGGGIPPMKECDSCDALIHLRTMVCPHCSHVHVVQENYDMIKPDFEVLVSRINVERYHKETVEQGHKTFKTFFKILNTSITILKHKTAGIDVKYSDLDDAFNTFESKVKEWCKLSGVTYNKRIKDFTVQNWKKEIKYIFANKSKSLS